MWIRSLSWKDPLEEVMAACSNIDAWRISWTEESGRLGLQCCKELDTTEATQHTHTQAKYQASLVAWTVKNLPAIQETQVQSLSWEDPLEKGMVTHSSILAWRIPWTEEPGGLQFMGSHRVRHN